MFTLMRTNMEDFWKTFEKKYLGFDDIFNWSNNYQSKINYPPYNLYKTENGYVKGYLNQIQNPTVCVLGCNVLRESKTDRGRQALFSFGNSLIKLIFAGEAEQDMGLCIACIGKDSQGGKILLPSLIDAEGNLVLNRVDVRVVCNYRLGSKPSLAVIGTNGNICYKDLKMVSFKTAETSIQTGSFIFIKY